MNTKDPALELAIKFHDTYERLAPSFGYETRPDTKQFDPTSKNGRLMVAVVSELAPLMNNFQQDIAKFNGIYKLPVATYPTLEKVNGASARLVAFKNILKEELDEIDEIIDATVIYEDTLHHDPVDKWEAECSILVSLADLLGDIQVYCASEMAKFGLPLQDILNIIMQSNFSKLGADGLPIYDERGKVQKGPNYYKPEPEIESLIGDLMAESDE